MLEMTGDREALCEDIVPLLGVIEKLAKLMSCAVGVGELVVREPMLVPDERHEDPGELGKGRIRLGVHNVDTAIGVRISTEFRQEPTFSP